jgi:Skp family chaperone for outer membrane proteins
MSNTIKTYHLAKLRVLRDELQAKSKEHQRKAKAVALAEEREAQWEIEKARATRLSLRYR